MGSRTTAWAQSRRAPPGMFLFRPRVDLPRPSELWVLVAKDDEAQRRLFRDGPRRAAWVDFRPSRASGMGTLRAEFCGRPLRNGGWCPRPLKVSANKRAVSNETHQTGAGHHRPQVSVSAGPSPSSPSFPTAPFSRSLPSGGENSEWFRPPAQTKAACGSQRPVRVAAPEPFHNVRAGSFTAHSQKRAFLSPARRLLSRSRKIAT
jgi:hypothetical protein